MNRKKIITALVFASAACRFCLYFYFPRKVAVYFVGSYSVRHRISQTREIIFSRKEDLLYVCSDSSNLLYHSDIPGRIEQFEFEKFDYLFVIGKEAMEVRYSPYISYFVDMDPHDNGQPVSVLYQGSLQHRVFVYRLPKNPKYRHLCC